MSSRDVMLKAKEAVLHALLLDNQLLEAHTALGMILYKYDYDFKGGEREYKRAIELNPNDSDSRQDYGELLMYLGRPEESLAEFRRALEIDPVSSGANWKYGQSLFFARRYDEAIAQLKNTLDLDNNYWPTHYALAITYEMKGDYAASVAERIKINELVGAQQTAAIMRAGFAKGGWQGFLRAMTGSQKPNIPAYVVATFHVHLGEKDKALAILNKMYEERARDLVMLKVDPRLDPLRSDPRFQDLVRHVGFTP
jgi:tetratricopeptide (TPR) repeat protein